MEDWTYDNHIRLIGKRVVDLPLVLIELFSICVTAEALRANIGWKSAISLQRGPVDPKFQVEVVAPAKHSSSQKIRLNDLSYGITTWRDLCYVLSQSTHLADRRTEFSSLDRVCIRIGLDIEQGWTSHSPHFRSAFNAAVKTFLSVCISLHFDGNSFPFTLCSYASYTWNYGNFFECYMFNFTATMNLGLTKTTEKSCWMIAL